MTPSPTRQELWAPSARCVHPFVGLRFLSKEKNSGGLENLAKAPCIENPRINGNKIRESVLSIQTPWALTSMIWSRRAEGNEEQ